MIQTGMATQIGGGGGVEASPRTEDLLDGAGDGSEVGSLLGVVGPAVVHEPRNLLHPGRRM